MRLSKWSAAKERARYLRDGRLVSIAVGSEPTMMDDVWVAVVHHDNDETFLAWQVDLQDGLGMRYMQVIGRTEAEIEAWLDFLQVPLAETAGEDISIRCYGSPEFVKWARKS
jgi:hypothetical protein